MSDQEKERYMIARGETIEGFLKTPAWVYLKEFLNEKITDYSSIDRIQNDNINDSFIKNKAMVSVYNGMINVIEKVWIDDAKKIKNRRS